MSAVIPSVTSRVAPLMLTTYEATTHVRPPSRRAAIQPQWTQGSASRRFALTSSAMMAATIRMASSPSRTRMTNADRNVALAGRLPASSRSRACPSSPSTFAACASTWGSGAPSRSKLR